MFTLTQFLLFSNFSVQVGICREGKSGGDTPSEDVPVNIDKKLLFWHGTFRSLILLDPTHISKEEIVKKRLKAVIFLKVNTSNL